MSLLKNFVIINSMLRLNNSSGFQMFVTKKDYLCHNKLLVSFKLHCCDNKHYVTTYFPLAKLGKNDLCRNKENSCRDKIRIFIQNAKLPLFNQLTHKTICNYSNQSNHACDYKFNNYGASQFKHDQSSTISQFYIYQLATHKTI